MSEIYELVDELAKKLEPITGISKVYREWPRPDQKLTLPSISLVTSNSRLMNKPPVTVMATDDPDGVSTLETIWVGDYETSIQLDIWTEYKAQREDFYDKVMQVFDSSVYADGTPSLKVKMSNYHDVWAAYYLGGFNYQDSPEMSLSGEWRLTMEIQANHPRVLRVNRPKITQGAIMEENID